MTHSSSPAVTAPSALFEPLAWPLYGALCLLWVVLLLLAPRAGLFIDPVLLSLWIPIGLLVWLAVVFRRRRLAAFATAVECYVLLNAICFSFVLCSFWIARLNAPYVDVTLDALERLIVPAFNWRRDVVAFGTMTLPLHIANFAYGSIKWQPALLIVVLSSSGLRDRCWVFVLAWTLSLFGTMFIFAIAPAVGAYSFHHIPHDMVSGVASEVGWRQPIMLERLRSGPPLTIGAADFLGIVEFPSFHTAAAILFCWAFWPVRWCRYVALLLNASMIFACVPIGGHYLTDIVAGMIVALAGIAAAHQSMRKGVPSETLPSRTADALTAAVDPSSALMLGKFSLIKRSALPEAR